MKSRFVKRGDLSKSSKDTNIYSPVASHNALRAVALWPNRHAPHPKGNRRLATVDNTAAYLQGDPYPPGTPEEFVKIRDPRTGGWIVLKMKCPIYGDDRAAKWYYESQRKQLLRQGFVQGYSPDGSCKVKQGYQRIPAANAPCIFYKPETDMVVLVYVDDMLLDGYEQDINIFLDEWHKRFETTDAEWLTDDNPIDFCGIIISQTAGAAIFLSMEPYILKTLDQYGMLDAKPRHCP